MSVIRQVYEGAIIPALDLLPPKMNSLEAICEMVAISGQEARFVHRVQLGNGPARGLWQFEEGAIGLKGKSWGLLNHVASRDLTIGLAEHFGIAPTSRSIWKELESNDVLAAALARLLLWTDPRALPPVGGNEEKAWQYYIRTWNPGKPHRHTWGEFYDAAVKFSKEL